MINYYLLTKPGIILGNLVTVAAGFLLASKGQFIASLFFATLIGLTFIIASACVFNNYIDRNVDQKMARTKNRPLASGLVTGLNALIFGTVLGLLGTIILFLYTNPLTGCIALVGFFVYVIPYSLWKVHTIYGTAIGSLAGATPPVIGYTAVSNQLDAGALILFTMMVLWQMPHFYAIALYHFDDYKRANIPALPIKKGILRTKIHMTLYILAFIPAAMLLTYFGFTGKAYLAVTLSLSLAWLVLSLKGFFTKDDVLFGKEMFRFSLLLITALCIAIPFDTV